MQCLSGPLAGQNFQLDGGPAFIFGRYSRCHFRLTADPAASQLHFLMDISEDRVRIVDLGSTNGLVVNDVHYGGRFGKPIVDFLTIKHGDSVLAGGSFFRLNIEGEDDDDKAAIDALKAALDSGAKHLVKPVRDRDFSGASDFRSESDDDKDRTAIGPSTGKMTETGSRFPEIEGYVMLGRIGVGGRGAVYKVIKVDSGEKAALKMLLPKTIKKPRAVEVFSREIKVTKQLDHPNIIRYLDNGVANDIPYLALEFAEGGNLDDYIRRSPDGRLDFGEAATLFVEVLEGLAYMHEKSLVHKDVKPKNILLARGKDGMTAKLSDMGLTSRMSTNMVDNFLPLVAEGGTPAYMPPEQLVEFTQALPQSDVFSAAATFYQMLSGELLYDFKGKDQAAVILDGNIRPILTLRPELPGRTAEVINKALSYYPENRYADAGEMLVALREAL
jgi:hypothetical protein